MRRRDLVGKRFGRLLVISRGESNWQGRTRWVCLCDCGKVTLVGLSQFYGNHTKSCGCLKHEKGLRINHGKTGSRTYICWQAMKRRCSLETCRQWKFYGGRGIKVCERWQSFENFLADMGEKPTGLTLDRIDNNGDYEPSNCRWVSQSQNCRNRRNNRLLTLNGETLSVAGWADKLNIPQGRIMNRVRRGWPAERILAVADVPFERLRPT